jgi:hypothetical protein
MDSGLVSVFGGRAGFAFTYSCDTTKDDQAEMRGHLTYRDGPSTVGGVEFPEIRLHGTVDPVPVEGAMTCLEAAEAYEGLPAVQFHGTYQPQDSQLEPGEFTVLVFDQGESGRTVGDVTGDAFAIELTGGAYDGYTRAGYIEGGNIQVQL